MVLVGDGGGVVVECVLFTLRGEFIAVHGCGGVELWVRISRVREIGGKKISEGGSAGQSWMRGTRVESGDAYIESARRWSCVSRGRVCSEC